MTRARVWVLLALTFVALLVSVMFDPGPAWIDSSLLTWGERGRSPHVTDILMALTQLGGAPFQVALGVLLVAVVAVRCRRSAAFLAAALLGSSLLNELVKVIVSRPRPTLVSHVYVPRGLSFPSGHSQSTMALALALALVLYRLRDGTSKIWIAAFALLPLVVGGSRVYLGVHYPSDVLGGWLLATCWVLGVDAWYTRVDVGVTRFE